MLIIMCIFTFYDRCSIHQQGCKLQNFGPFIDENRFVKISVIRRKF